MAKAGSAAALAALGALGAMALRKRGRGGDENFSEMENIPAKQAPAALHPPVAETEAEPFQENSDAVATARLESAVPRAKYNEGKSNRGKTPKRDVPFTSIEVPRGQRPFSGFGSRAGSETMVPSGAIGSDSSYAAPGGTARKKGGMIKASKPAVGKASKRADGIAQRGKTKGRYL
jgi:hypothetical protein